MTVLRLVPVGGTRIGQALAMVDSLILARQGGTAYAEAPVALVPRLARALAFAGIAVEPCDEDLAPPVGRHVAQGLDLTPLPAGTIDLDLVRLERIPLGRATRALLRRRLAGLLPASAAARARCRDLLRGDDVLFAWARHAWGSRAALRSAHARRALRPVVFDRDAVARGDLAGRTSSRDDEIGRWLFA